MRKNKAFSALALSLSVDLRSTFRVDELRYNMKAASALYNQIDLVTRKLRQGESVSAYVDDVGRKVTQLRQANGEFEEWQHASLLLSNCVLVFRELAREHADWINNNNRKSLNLAEALQRLRSAEHQRAQLQQQSKPAVPRGMQVAQVTSSSNNSKKRSKQQRKRNKGITDKTMKTNCASCNGEGHWYAECTENTGIPLKAELAKKLKEKQAKKNPMSPINSVRRVEMIPSADAQGLIASLCTESEPMNIEDIVGNRSTAAPSPTSRSASTALSASAGGDGQEAADLLMQMANVSSSPPHQQLQLPREALPAQGLQPSQEGQGEQGAVQRQWEGPLQGTPPTWENLLFQLGQGLKQSLQGATSELWREEDRPRGVILCRGTTMWTLVLSVVDVKGHQCVDVDATDRQCVDADAVGRHHVDAAAVGHRHEDAGAIDRQSVDPGRHHGTGAEDRHQGTRVLALHPSVGVVGRHPAGSSDLHCGERVEMDCHLLDGVVVRHSVDHQETLGSRRCTSRGEGIQSSVVTTDSMC
ncbi:hypothetical protein PR003_g14847 [Phytophthora rubi]|uniref:Uncharacterized protein n=1 Tax=Phytophthora rubi TaxID=129364 RepID=A0A6A4ETG0_9STRA|nr:hypothetical protein PR001_g13886 [Phytophthora rubi]KAE9331761.1 hypothetical protein PR003_g14847 [Phytophthora rubi]